MYQPNSQGSSLVSIQALQQRRDTGSMLTSSGEFRAWSPTLQVFEMLGIGVLLLDEWHQIQQANDTAVALLAGKNVLEVGGRFTDPRYRHPPGAFRPSRGGTHRIQNWLNELVDSDNHYAKNDDPAALKGWDACVVPVGSDNYDVGYLVLFQGKQQRANSVFDNLAQIFSLSTAERSVLEYLAQGHSNKCIARLRKVGVETVKAQIKSIFSKTSCKSRGELSKLILDNVVSLGSYLSSREPAL